MTARVLRFFLVLAALAWFGAGGAWAANLNFNGGAVGNCTYDAPSKTYTCKTSPLTSDTDVMTIASGYTVDVTTNLVFGWGQSLVTSGTAFLKVLGTFNVAAMNPPNLKVSGGTLKAYGDPAKSIVGTFLAGSSSQTLTADISADTARFGTGAVTITGNLDIAGAVDFASYSTVTGDLTVGSFSAGTIAAPATNITINGSITADTSIMLPNQSKVTGDVTAATLRVLAAETTIYGNATVGSATLDYHARVAQTIYCTGGTAQNKCDCVTNNSNYAVNTAMGPTCAPKASIDHFLIKHDGTGSACTADTVTVTACGNAACSTLFTGGVSGTMSPGGAAFSIAAGASAATTTVQQNSIGSATLAVTSPSVTPAAATTCNNTGANNSSCTMQFTGSPGMTLVIPDHYAGSTATGTLKNSIVTTSGTASSCGPAFTGATTVTMSCSYDNPTTGTRTVNISPAGTGGVNLNCGTGASQTLSLTFDANGSANVAMKYLDAGAVGLKMTAPYGTSALTATDQVVAAPSKIGIYSPGTPPTAPPATIIAGKATTLVLQALDASNNILPNFGKETTAETITVGYNDTVPCADTMSSPAGDNVVTTLATSGANSGYLTAAFVYPEAGKFRYAAKFTNTKYLGVVTLPPPSPSPQLFFGDGGCGTTLPYSNPAYFTVKAGASRTLPAGFFYYSGQPIDVTVTAWNGASPAVVTKRYDNPTYNYANDVQLDVIDPLAQPLATPPVAARGAVGGGSLPKTAFKDGVGTLLTADSSPPTAASATKLTYTYTNLRTNPTTKLALRAAETVTTANKVSSAAGPAGAEGPLEVRNGRIRIGGAFGGAREVLTLPVTAESFDGTVWRVNTNDTFTIPPANIGFGIAAGTLTTANLSNLSHGADTCAGMGTQPNGTVCIKQGKGKLVLQPTAGIGTVVAVFNVGATGAAVDDCLAAPAIATASALNRPWYRSPNGICAANYAGDPATRATFGVFSPETKRIIHAREVFN